jgi:undecaprenyl-diphosphatase
MGGLLAGQSRTTTTDYSFLLVMSVLIATIFHERFKNLNLLHGEDNRMLAVGFIMSMVIALIVAKTFLRSATRHDFTSSALFRIGLGLLALT